MKDFHDTIAVTGYTENAPFYSNLYNQTLSVVSVSVLTALAGTIPSVKTMIDDRASSDTPQQPWNVGRFFDSELSCYPNVFCNALQAQEKLSILQIPFIQCENAAYSQHKALTLGDDRQYATPTKNSFAFQHFFFPFISIMDLAQARKENPMAVNIAPIQLKNACNMICRNRETLSSFFKELPTARPPRKEAPVRKLHDYARKVFLFAPAS